MTTVAALLQEYYQSNPRIRAKATRDQYGFALNDFRTMLRREPLESDLDDVTLGKFASWLLRKKCLAPRTVNERVGRLCALCTWMARTGQRLRHPFVRRIPEPVRMPQAWTEDDLKKLMASIQHLRGWVGRIPACDWWRSLHLVAWDSGERITAILSCRWDWIVDGWLTVPAEVRKGQSRDMTYHLSIDTLKSLEDIRKPERDLIFPWPLNRAYLWSRYKAIRGRAGLPTDRRSSFHRIRKSVATHAAVAGQNPTALLGHADPRTTQQYLDPRILRPPQASDVLFRIG